MSAALTETALSTSSIFVIAIGASMFAVFMALSTLPNTVAEFLLAHVDNTYAVIAVMAALVIVMGMFVDAISLLLLALPILLPVLRGMEVNPIWFDIIMIKSALGKTVPLGQIFSGAA